MISYKKYRFKDNPKEKDLHDEFIRRFSEDSKTLSAIVFGWKTDRQDVPLEYLTDREKMICLTLIQWLGSSVGQGFLIDCGFKLDENENS